MRIRVWHVVFFLAALMVFAALRTPISFLAPSREGGFSYSRAAGTVWAARFEGARIGGLDAGEVDWRLSLRQIFTGRLDARARLSGGAVTGEVTLLANFENDRRIVAPSLEIAGAAFDRLALAGETRIEGLDLYFEDGRCMTAAGRLTSDVLTRNGETLFWRGPPLQGRARCDGADALLPLDGADETGVLNAAIRLSANGAGLWRVEARTAREEVAAMLTGAGFSPLAGGQGATRQGRFRWLLF
ncbi:MAG: type II secretion system protein N [Hyphomonadaceae bacterium]